MPEFEGIEAVKRIYGLESVKTLTNVGEPRSIESYLCHSQAEFRAVLVARPGNHPQQQVGQLQKAIAVHAFLYLLLAPVLALLAATLVTGGET